MTRDMLLHRQLSYSIVGVLMDVHNSLGPGWDEYDYHRAALKGLESKGLRAQSKLGGVLNHRGLVADAFELDVIVEDRVILELKHLDADFAEAHFVQIINYLKLWQKDLGILVDFGHEGLRYRRVPYTRCMGVWRSKVRGMHSDRQVRRARGWWECSSTYWISTAWDTE